MKDALAVGAVTLAGVLALGPLLNHAVARWVGWRVVLPLCLGWVPDAHEVGRPPGRCIRCSRPLAPRGIPALPATIAGGRCRGCGAPLARRYMAVELATGGVFGLAAAAVGWQVALVPVLALAAGLVAIAAVDLAVMRIPTHFVYGTAAAVTAGLVLAAVVDGPVRRLEGALVGAAAYGVVLLALHLISPRALGFGDVRLATLVGAVVGWAAWRSDHPILAPIQGALHAALLAGLIGSVIGGVLLVARGRDRQFPFGPPVAAGGLIVALVAI